MQNPDPPIILGAEAGPKTVADMAGFCDGWMPLTTREDIAGQIVRVKQAVADAGRDPDRFQIIANGAKTDHVEALEAVGVDEVILVLPPLSADANIPRLDKLAGEAGS